MMIKIECYQRSDGKLSRTIEKDLLEYSKWIGRAVKRGYTVESAGEDVIVHGGEGTRDFLVKIER